MSEGAPARLDPAREDHAADRRTFLAFLEKPRRFLLTTHINPDGDGLGSEVAMALWLRAMGKQVRVLNDSPVPPAFDFLARHLPLEGWDAERAERAFTESDVLLVLDTSNRQRIGRVAEVAARHVIAIAVVDHHVTHSRGFGQVNVIEPEASSTGEILYELMNEAGAEITPAIAEALYVALMTDTGSFRYSNATPAAHRMAADLIERGVDPQLTHNRVHTHASPGRLRFFGEVLGALEVLAGGRLVVLEAAPEQFEKHGLVGADTEGLVDLPRTIAGVEAVALFSEVDRGKVKVSLRSTGRVSIDQVCSRLGGGGHAHAAGVLMRGSRADARGRVIPELERLVSALPPPGTPEPA